MDLRHLRSFVTVAQELSFRAAAKRLGMSQPPLSRQIKVLEEEVGVRLLERDRNRRVALTDAGQTFLADAKRTLAAAEATLRHTREAANGARGRLNVANTALSTRVVPPLLQLFRVLHAEVEVFMVELERTEQLAALREGRIHVGIYPDLCTPQDRQFQSQGLFACPMVAVLPPSHPDAGAEDQEMELDIHALAKDTVLIPSPDYSPGYQDDWRIPARRLTSHRPPRTQSKGCQTCWEWSPPVMGWHYCLRCWCAARCPLAKCVDWAHPCLPFG